MAIILAILIPTLLGLLLLGLLLRQDAGTSPLMRIGMSFPVGMGLITIQIFLLGLLRVPLALPYVAIPPIAEIALLALAIWRTKARILPSFPSPPAGGRPWPVIVAVLIVSCWAIVKIGSVFVETMLRPIYAWDSWANWSASAKAFYYARGLLLDAPSGEFFGRGIVSRIVEYPLHNTLSQLWFALWAGGFDEILVKIGSPVTFLCLSAAIYGIAKKEIGTFLALFMLVIFMGSPLLSYHAIEVYSDLPLGMYMFLSLTAFSLSMQGNRAYWPLVGLFSALALFTKDEAVFFVLPLVVSALVFVLRDRSSAVPSRSQTIARLVFPLLLVAPWFVFKIVHGIGMGSGGITVVFTFHPEVIGQMLAELLSLSNFSIVPLFLGILFIVSGMPSRQVVHLAVPIACYAAFFAAVYCLTTFYYNFFSNGTVFFRNVLTWYPSLCLLIILLIGKCLPDDWRISVGEQPRSDFNPQNLRMQ